MSEDESVSSNTLEDPTVTNNGSHHNSYTVKFINVIVLSSAFMFLFTAFQTTSIIEEVVTEGARQSDPHFNGNGYTSLAIIYVVFSVSNWMVPSIVSGLGDRITMIIGGACYCIFIGSFIKPMTWLFYSASVLVGFGAALLWTAQGSCLTNNSDDSTMARNSGLFWAFLQSSLLWGNLMTYFEFADQPVISSHIRIIVYIILTSVCAVGVVMFCLLRRLPHPDDSSSTSDGQEQRETPGQAFKNAVYLLRTPQMLQLCFPFAYTGFELTFLFGIYGTSVGHTQRFGGNAKSLQSLCGMLIGAGEITGGAIFGLLGSRTTRKGRSPVVFLGLLCHMISFYLIWLMLAEDSPISETTDTSYITARKWVVLLVAFMMGFADACYNTQIYSLMGFLYSNNSAPAFAILKFVQSIAAGVAFFYGSYLYLQWQLVILVVTNCLGFGGFAYTELRALRRIHTHQYQPVVNED